MNTIAEMMEQQKTENETSVKLDAKACEKHLGIDFNNIEDILDFSACHSIKLWIEKSQRTSSSTL